MRGLFFPRDDADLDVPETAFFEELVQLNFAESEPVIRVKFARFFESMAQQIEDHQSPATFQHPMGSSNGARGMNGVMQGLAENRKINTLFRNRRVLNITPPALKVFVYLSPPHL